MNTQTDPLLAALIAFSEAAKALNTIWHETEDDGNHPIVTSGMYPFAKSFAQVYDDIRVWTEDAKLTAADGGDVALVMAELDLSDEQWESIPRDVQRKLLQHKLA